MKVKMTDTQENISKIKENNILELLNDFIDFMESNKKWKLLKWSNNDPKKDFIEDINDILNEKTSKIWASLIYFSWSSSMISTTASINFFINKKTMKWNIKYSYKKLKLNTPDIVKNFDSFIDFKKFFLEN